MARVAKKKEEAVSLETVLWNCRVALRGVGSTDKNRDAVIGLCFLKFAGDKFEKRRAELIAQYGDIPAFLEKASFYNAVNVFYLKETARWAYIVKNAGANDIAVILDQAMADIEESNPSLKGALSLNLYATLGAPKEKIKQLIDEVNKIDESRFHEEDLIPWALDDGIGTMLPVMQSDIMLTSGSEVLIIDAKYYTHTTQTQYDVHTLHSGNLYQIFTYVKNKDAEFGDQPHKVSGMLLYAVTDEAIQPDNSYQMSGNMISVKTLDLNREFSEIAAQLNAIVDEHFEEKSTQNIG